MENAEANTTPVQTRRHSTPLRGLDTIPSSDMNLGRFGRMFRNLPVFRQDEADLVALAGAMIQDPEEETEPGKPDKDENTEIPSGYTYLGQFIDHDLTFDPVSSLQRQNDPDALIDFRTPRFDLDNLFGRGPDDEPFMYQPDGLRLATGLPKGLNNDLPRNPSNKRALIGDPRNDENVIVSQLHATFIAFYNKVVDRVGADPAWADKPNSDRLKEAQRLVRWHYQWVVLHDFLPRILGGRPKNGMALIDDILRAEDYVAGIDARGNPIKSTTIKPDLRFYDLDAEPFMPVEFSAAAYRFGHSMVRPSYFLNDFVTDHAKGGKNKFGRIPIFSPDNNPLSNLNGFRELPDEWGIDWSLFYELPGKRTPQNSYKIDTSIVNPLRGLLEARIVNDQPSSLAERNLRRGRALGLPSGQVVARAMGLTPLSDAELDVGEDDREIALGPSLKGNAPLWYYVLREAELTGGAAHLGPVGGRIVAEVFVGLLWNDPLSYLRVEPNWTPTFGSDGRFGMPELVTMALGG